MTTPPANSDEDYYMDEPFDEESLSEVEEEQEIEEGFLDESDSHSESDVEAEYLRGNVSSTQQQQDQLQELTIKQFSLNPVPLFPQPHARRQQLYAKLSGGGTGFARESQLAYNSSSSDDETKVVITETVAEVNQLTLRPEQPDDDEETVSVRTLVPSNDQIDDEDQTEMEDNEIDENDYVEVEDELGDEDEITSEDDDDGKSESSNDEKEDDVQTGQLEGKDEEEDDDEDEEDEVEQITELKAKAVKNQQPNQDLVDVEDANASDMESDENSDTECEIEPEPAPQKNKRMLKTKPSETNKLNVVVKAPLVKQLDFPDDDEVDEANISSGDGLGMAEQLNVKFLEQQMKQMSEMIMKTYRLNGGTPDNSAFEQMAMATNLLQKQGKKMCEMYEDEELEESKATNSVRSEKLNRRSCRCPSSTDVHQPKQDQCLMDECGQGDGLLRYSNASQQNSSRINCRVSSVTPSSYNSDHSGYHIEVGRRPRSVCSSDVNYKNLGRKSFSFTNPQVREIERANNILLKKMMNVKPTIKPTINAVKSNTNLQAKKQAGPRLTSAAVNRRKYQRQIDLDNDVLKRKLEAVGSRRPLFK